jgi:EAL domain-containing protein (putative c-di-GMP-specific phosphodiesterase class I)
LNAPADSRDKTLEALAQVIRALASEVCGVSFHDFGADTLWMSEDFLLPEDHTLVEESLAGTVENAGVSYADREEGVVVMAVPVLDSLGAIAGVVRLTVNQAQSLQQEETLHARLGPVLACVAAEFERRQSAPSLPKNSHEWLAIDQALDQERFELFLQPIRSLNDSASLAHHEVLVRLRTADGELVEPKGFFAKAMERQLLPAIDRWVLRTLLVWLANNRKVWGKVPAVFCINLAPQSMTDRHFIAYLEACVRKSGLPPQALCFEVTERFASSGSISVAESMRRLEALGCEVALDDFGGHATSYGYLRAVPAHYFKIDRALVGAAPSDRIARATISAIVRMAEDLGVQTVAEAVELDSELEAVRSLGVTFAQGYLLGRPHALEGYSFTAPKNA